MTTYVIPEVDVPLDVAPSTTRVVPVLTNPPIVTCGPELAVRAPWYPTNIQQYPRRFTGSIVTCGPELALNEPLHFVLGTGPGYGARYIKAWQTGNPAGVRRS